MASEHPKVPPIQEIADRWARNSLASLEARIAARLDQVGDSLRALAGNLDHLHQDLVGLREVARIPRPECYPAGKRPPRGRRATVPPPPARPPAKAIAPTPDASDEERSSAGAEAGQ